MSRLPVLGWKEQVSLPDWGVRRMRAKLDTGARSSALHVARLELPDSDEGEVAFEILVGSRDEPRPHLVRTPLLRYTVVRDTGANAERRPLVRTRVVCGPMVTDAEITLTDRAGMNFRMLLGRIALAGRCLVDPSQGYLHTPAPPSRTQRAATTDGGGEIRGGGENRGSSPSGGGTSRPDSNGGGVGGGEII